MKLEGSYIINASKEEVWLAMNNPEILQASIPGCESLEKLSETQFTAIVKAKIGPVKASFTGEVSLENLNPPHSYTLTGEGKGGLAGFASGAADITLSEHDEGTELQYEVEAQVGGVEWLPLRRVCVRCPLHAACRMCVFSEKRRAKKAKAAGILFIIAKYVCVFFITFHSLFVHRQAPLRSGSRRCPHKCKS